MFIMSWIRVFTAIAVTISVALNFVQNEQIQEMKSMGRSVIVRNATAASVEDESEEVTGATNNKNVTAATTSTNTVGAAQRLRLIGERHSGTNFVHDFLAKCFPRQMNSRGTELNFKHWYQPTPEYLLRVMKREEANTTYETGPFRGVETTLHSWQEIAYKKSGGVGDPSVAREEAIRDTHFIMMVRDPYDWMESMRKGPYHWPHHAGTYKNIPDANRKLLGRWQNEPLPWRKFITKPLNFEGERTETAANVVCQKGYMSGMVQPCVSQAGTYMPAGFNEETVPPPGVLPWAARDPMYEMDPETHEPFPNPLALREYKLQMMLDLQKHWNVHGFHVVRYEDLSTEYLTNLVQQLSTVLGGVQPECDVASTNVRLTAKKNIHPDYAAWIMENANWTIEASVGYTPV